VAIQIPVDSERIAALCQQYHIRSLAVFGSVLRDNFRPDSDVDILVQFDECRTPGWELFDIEDELSAILGRVVTL